MPVLRVRRRAAALAAAVLLVGCAGAAVAPARRVRHYERRVREHPNLYPAWISLGAAHLDLARRSLDPAELAAAREAADRSLAIQPSLEGYKLRAAAEAFGHRFAEAVEWGMRARTAAAEGEDAGVTALLVEAWLGLGRSDEAQRLLGDVDRPPERFHAAAALGLWWLASGGADEAEAAFVEAARLAREAGVPALEAWAWVRAAGVRLDTGRPDLARPHLARAAAIAPDDFELAIHRAELAHAEGRDDEAVDRYLRLLRRRDDPEIHRRAFLLLRERGPEAAADRHLRAAERIYRRAIDAGEVYTLEGLARLYCDAGIHLDEAERLAEANLRHKRDRTAREALACVRESLRDQAGATSSRASKLPST
jgi:tetratricopeptide (TPR) repeat protein